MDAWERERKSLKLPKQMKNGEPLDVGALDGVRRALECSGYRTSIFDAGDIVPYVEIQVHHPEPGSNLSWNMPKRLPPGERNSGTFRAAKRLLSLAGVEPSLGGVAGIPLEWTCLPPKELLSRLENGKTVLESSAEEHSKILSSPARGCGRVLGGFGDVEIPGSGRKTIATDILSWASFSDEPKGRLLTLERPSRNGEMEIFRVSDRSVHGEGCWIWTSEPGRAFRPEQEVSQEDAFKLAEDFLKEGFSVAGEGFVPAAGLADESLLHAVKMFHIACLECWLSEAYDSMKEGVPSIERYAHVAVRIPEVFADHVDVDLPPTCRLTTPASSYTQFPSPGSFPEVVAETLVSAVESLSGGVSMERTGRVLAAWSAFKNGLDGLAEEDRLKFEMLFLSESGGLDRLDETEARLAAFAANISLDESACSADAVL